MDWNSMLLNGSVNQVLAGSKASEESVSVRADLFHLRAPTQCRRLCLPAPASEDQQANIEMEEAGVKDTKGTSFKKIQKKTSRDP